MKEMILLGAGASVEANVPDSYKMTERILEIFENKYSDKYTKIVSFVIGGLLFQNGIQGLNPLKIGVNVEDLFNAIELLANRHTLEAAAFVGSWHAMIDEFDKIDPPRPNLNALHRVIYKSVTEEIIKAMPHSAPPFGDHNIDRNLKTTIESMISNRGYPASFINSVSKAIGDYVVKLTNDWLLRLRKTPMPSIGFQREFQNAINQTPKPGEGQIFDEVTEYMIRSLANIVWIDDSAKVSYLRPLLEPLKTQQKLTIATLNYDNSIEVLTENLGTSCSTGISEWSNSGNFEMVEKGILLLKLHGSIDWASSTGQQDENRPLPYKTISRVPAEKVKEAGFRPAVIFGHRNKLTADGPFLDLLRAFQRELGQTERLTIIGYSFGDVHINVYLSNWLNQNKDHKIRIIEPKFQKSQNEFAQQLKTIKGERLEIIEEKAGEGLRIFSSLE
jgi:hypothetical protein